MPSDSERQSKFSLVQQDIQLSGVTGYGLQDELHYGQEKHSYVHVHVQTDSWNHPNF
jgi:hypothetical protein